MGKQSTEDAAYERGRADYRQGKLIFSNPFPEGTRERTSWYAGWEAEEQKAAGKMFEDESRKGGNS